VCIIQCCVTCTVTTCFGLTRPSSGDTFFRGNCALDADWMLFSFLLLSPLFYVSFIFPCVRLFRIFLLTIVFSVRLAFTVPSHQSVCLYVYPSSHCKATALLSVSIFLGRGKHVPAETNTRNNRKTVERFILYAACVLSKESRRLVLPRPSCSLRISQFFTVSIHSRKALYSSVTFSDLR
jgi:hypothetical protein